jgi:superfamily II DNA/RNA helicase
MKSENSEYEVSESFSSTGLNEFICECLCRVGFHKPTPIQYYGIKLCVNNPNKNLIARAKSGTGKTLAFAAFVLHHLQMVSKLEAKTYSVIILPTRELAIQVYQLFKTIL